jgi:RNA polymerase sigma factor (sigma-70 family)
MTIPASDADDWQSALAGDGEAFARIFDRHQHRVYRHSLALVPTIDDAQDVVGITFLEAWRKRGTVRFVDGSMLPWLLVTASNTSRNVSRSARRYRALLERVPRPEPFAGPDSVDDGSALDALRQLTPVHRAVVTLCIIEGLSEAEAAAALGVPVGTVKSRLHRAKKALGSRLRLSPTDSDSDSDSDSTEMSDVR